MFRQLLCIILIAILFLCAYYIQSNNREGFLQQEQLQYNTIVKNMEYINSRWPMQFEVGTISDGDGAILFSGHLQKPSIHFTLPKPQMGQQGEPGLPGNPGPTGNPGPRGYSGNAGLSVYQKS